MLQGFKEFILRGNVVELAVAVVVGSAFQKVVDTFVSAIVTPLINAAGNPETSGLGFSIRHDTAEMAQATFINLSTIINALIVFILTAAVVYFIFIVPMNKFAALTARPAEPEPVVDAEEVALLKEIRDELRANRA